MDIKKLIIAAEQHLKDGRLEQAQAICAKVLKKEPDNIDAIFLLGSVYLNQKNYSESKRLLEQVLSPYPDHLGANNNLGVVFLEQKDLAAAEKCFKKVVELDPCHVNALVNLGNIYSERKQWESAETLYKKVLAIDPGNGVALNNLGRTFVEQNRIDEGIAYLQQALQFLPENSKIYLGLISALFDKRDMAECVDMMSKILNLSNPGPALIFAFYVAQTICQWDISKGLRDKVVDIVMNGGMNGACLIMLNLIILSDPNTDNETLFQIVQTTANDIDKSRLGEPFQDCEKSMQALRVNRRLRIGYLSGDFCNHVCNHFTRSLINYYDKNHFEVFCYSNTPVGDEITEEYKSNVDAFIDVRDLTDQQFAKRIHEDGIHILVDLSGYTKGTRISVMSYRAAPVQITYMGYPYSSGFRSVDYIISDPYLDGPLNAKYWTETPLRLPECAVAFGELYGEEINPVPPFERYGYVTFGSLINPYKLNPEVIRAWSMILKALPDARIVLNHPYYVLEITRQNILKEFAKYDITEERLQFIWEQSAELSHLRYYNDIDISLDTFPMTGGQTMIDAVWMGVPVVTLVGETHYERASYTVLKNISVDVEDIVAFSQEEYIQKAVALANNPVRIAELHRMIPDGLGQSILCDPERFARQLESAYIEGWNRKFPENQYDPGTHQDGPEFVSVRSGVDIAVSGSIDEPFTYILKEQEGWFDLEYDFILDMIQPDMRVLDIGSEVGAYAVPLAKKMVDGGGVWAVSTDPAHSRYLLKSKDHNKLKNLHILPNVRLGNFRLDEEMLRHDWSEISFVRMNIGGREYGLVKSGEKFFSQSSPLVMLGIKGKQKRDLSLVEIFKAYGYTSYRFIQGLNTLAPFDSANEPDELDDFSMHLFCCNQHRAEQLERLGILIQKVPPPATLADCNASFWKQYIGALPYAAGVMTHWLNVPSHQDGWEWYQQAVNFFAMAKTEKKEVSDRYACIQSAHNILWNLLTDRANVSRVMSMVRILTEMGKRVLAVKVLGQLAELFETGEGSIVMNIDEPFLALSDGLASVNPGDRIAEWIYASVLEQREKLRAFSSYYTGKESLEILDKIKDIGFQSDEMERRRQLIRMRYRMDEPM